MLRITLRRALSAALTIVIAAVAIAVPAQADAGDPPYLTVTKTVSNATPDPGEPFTFEVLVNCSEASCIEATLLDEFPAELAGFEVRSVLFTPSDTVIPRTVTWTVDGVTSSTPPSVLTADTSFEVDFTGAVTAPSGTGLQFGRTFAAQIELVPPATLSPGTYSGTNVAYTAAANSEFDQADATVTVTVAEELGIDTTKVWSPAQSAFSVGAASTISLSATNASNIDVASLSLQEPQVAPNGASALDASNPFTMMDFTSLTSVVAPVDATGMQLDAYVFSAGSWDWVSGTPGAVTATPALPSGVDASEVGGVRITYTGTEIDHDGEMSFDLNLVQRATHRDSVADLSLAQQQIDNTAIATVTAPDLAPATDTATATHIITPPSVAAAVTKNFAPASIAAGDATTMTLRATNESDVAVTTLTVSDHNFFTDHVDFVNFANLVWPVNAQTANVTYFMRGAIPETRTVTAPLPLSPPPGPISGFTIEFVSGITPMPAGAFAVIDVNIDTDEAATATATRADFPNTVTSRVEATNGATASATDSATLILARPSITASVNKTVRPGGAVSPGDDVVVALESRVVASSNYVTLHEIVVEDTWAGDETFWDAFNLDSIAPTQVPAEVATLVEVFDGTSWTALASFPAQTSPHLVSLNTPMTSAALGSAGLDANDVRGIRFTFSSVNGMAQDTTVTPYVVATARNVLRSGGAITEADDQPASYPNTVTVVGEGETPEGTPITDDDTDDAVAEIVTGPPGVGVGIDKEWNLPTVNAQSGELRRTDLTWSVEPGMTWVEIEDTGDGTPVADSVFDAFDLERILPINANSTPFSQGWYLKYDQITSIELFDGTAWNAVTVPAGGWIDTNGRFVGYVLSDAERESTVGVRITLVEDGLARAAAQVAGPQYDPYVALLEPGVASAGTDRVFGLQWQIRNTTRSGGDWVTDQITYNTPDAGVVDNVATVTGVAGTTPVVARDNDTIIITNPGAGVQIRKQVNPGTAMYVPDAGTSPALFPSARFVVEAQNNSVAATSYVRVMDSPLCISTAPVSDCESPATPAAAKADPFDTSIDWLTRDDGNNVFDRFTLTNVDISASIPAEIDRNSSVVWLLRYTAGVYTTEPTTITGVHAMTPAQLANVVGVSVTYQGTNPAVDGGTITAANNLTMVLDVQARTHLRVSGVAQDLSANQTVHVPNGAFAQSIDPVLNAGALNGAYDDATAILTGGDINVGASKSVTPSLITEPRRHDPVAVNIGGNQGTAPTSTLAPAEVRFEDSVATAPEFWDYFNFVSLGAITAPAGADRVAVSAYGPFGAGGAHVWVDGPEQLIASAAMPVTSAQYPLVEGVRFVFSRDDGGFFSTAVPAPAWSANIAYEAVLRDTLRGSGAAIALPDTVENVVEVVSDRLNGESSVVREADAVVQLSLGTFELEVAKVANDGVRTASAGESVPWELTFTNAGTGYLTIEELRDELPMHLLYLGTTAPVYTPDPSGMLGAPTSIGMDGTDLVLTWPAGGRTMAPGETFTMRVELELQPGLSAGDRATNTMVVTTAETLDRCGPVQSGNTVTNDWNSDPTTCGASDYVTPQVGPNLFTVKGVRGAFGGAINPADPSFACVQNLTATGGDYYRAPCAANSVIGGVDEWVLRVQNAGTTGVSEIEVFDALPAPGDAFFISGMPRGSEYRPQMLDDLAVELPGGATYTVSTTTTAGACQGTWGNLENQEPCEQHGETWTPVSPATVWADVTGVRVKFDFSATPDEQLEPGEFIDITFSTENVPASATHTDGAPVAVPVVDTLAWNQFGVKYRDLSAPVNRKISPAHVGVHLVTGSLAVHKEFTGSGAALAPATILADVACEVEGQALTMGSFGTVALNSAANYEARIDGLPVGSECVVSEQGSVGTFFEISRPADDVPVTVSQAIAWTDPVPADHVATLINEYEPVLALTGVMGLQSKLGWIAALLVLGAGMALWSARRRLQGD